MKTFLQALLSRTEGAVAPTVALSLFGLLAIGGIAFDYSRMASLDTELQSAADQAALAAATQLDGGTSARARATAAANDLLRNITVFASATNGPSGDTERIAVPTVQFYESYNATTDVPGTAASTDAAAKVVIVTVGARRAQFAMTPILGALNSGDISAQAVATLSSSVCKIPPLMVCAPGSNYPQPSDLGKGILLEAGGGGAWVPGNYGYLEAAGGNGANAIRDAIGRNSDAAACASNDTGLDTKTGNMASVPNWLNTRMDVYAKNNVPACSGGNFCPSQNVRKDMSRNEEVDVVRPKNDPQPANPGCGAAGATVKDDYAWDSAVPNFPRDNNQTGCTTNDNSCPKFGTGEWGKDAYVAAVHSSTTTAAIAAAVGKTAATLTRWDIYNWELANPGTRMGSQLLSTTVTEKTQGQNKTWTFANKCAYPVPKNGTPVIPDSNQKDRRLLTVAVVDCTGQNGRFNAHVLRFVDMFLVQPSLDRGASTGKDQIYVETVRIAQRPGGQSAFQFYLRQRPRLIK